MRRIVVAAFALLVAGSPAAAQDSAKSRMEACKGHFQHLQALARLKNLRTNWVCWIVGGPQRPQEEKYFCSLKDAAEELGISGRLRFLGQRSDVPRLLAASDIFCHSHFRGARD